MHRRTSNVTASSFRLPLQIGQSRFHKSHAFDFNKDVPVCLDGKSGIGASRLVTVPLSPSATDLASHSMYLHVRVCVCVCAGGKALPGQSPKQSTSVYPKGVGGDKPAWLAFDRQVGYSWQVVLCVLGPLGHAMMWGNVGVQCF